MTVQYPMPPTAVLRNMAAAPQYTEAAAGTACLSSGWPDTSASFNGLRIVEDRQEWILVPLERQQEELKPAAPTRQNDLETTLATIAVDDTAVGLRRAFRTAFRILDDQMLDGQWAQVQRLLLALLSESYSIDLGVGALRFCSSAFQHIPDWPELLKAARVRCDKAGADYKVVLRGLC